MPWPAPAAVVVLLAVSVVLPLGAAGTPADEVAWPKDVGAPFEARVANLEVALGASFDYWTYADAMGFRSDWGVYGAPGVRSSDAMDQKAGELVVSVVRDGNTTTLRLPAERRIVEEQSGVATLCENGACTSTPTYRTRQIDTVRPNALPVGLRFDAFNRLVIEGPPGTFSAFGRGMDGVRNFTAHLGLPGERIDWAAVDILPSSDENWWIVPEVEEVMCDCWAMSLVEDDNVTGTASLAAVFARNEIVQVALRPWLRAGLVPLVNQTEATAVVRDHLDALGHDRWVERFGGTKQATDHRVMAVFLPEHGLAWRFNVIAESPDGKAIFEVFVDAEDGKVVDFQMLGVLGAGYAQRTSPTLWAVGLLLLAVVVLTRRWGK